MLFMPFLKQHPGVLLWVVLAAGILIVAPYANFQDYLSQGDHGRDLYAAQAVYRGELPYKDFWWVYGPLTPYYYGLFFKVFGVKVSSMILGKLILRVVGGLLIYLALCQIASETAACLGACWFMLFQQDFFFTYNHIAGIVMITGVLLCLLSYIQTNASRAAWGSLGFTFILCLIKINFGLVALAMCVLTVFVCDKSRDRHHFLAKDKKSGVCPYFYITAFLGLPMVVFIIYWSMLHGLSAMEIRQCLPYKEGDQPYTISPWVAIANFLQNTFMTIKSNWTNLTFALIINGSALRCLYLLAKNKFPAPYRTSWLLSIGMICLFYLANSHEYLKSGVWYRDFWAQPLSIMLIFVLIDTATKSIPHWARKVILTFIMGLGLWSWFSIFSVVNAQKVPSQYLNLPQGGIYLSNTPSWITTVEQTTDFLNKTLKPDELFFALPYDCLYYYLTGKRTPTRQLIFFEHIKIPEAQERSVIVDLERNHVNYAVVSSRAFVHQELGLGVLGKTYCPLIGKYLQDNFVAIARFGDWNHEPGWAWNHGTLILRRKGLL
jgi:hypothetical protein